MRRVAMLLLMLCSLAGPAGATVEPALAPPPGARLPLDLPMRDELGRAMTLRDFAGDVPIVLAFADYACTTLCGTALGMAAALLPETGLRAGADHVFLVIGLDPRQGLAEAAAMRRAHVPDGTALATASHFLIADAAGIAAATGALGYRAVRRADDGGFDHPLALLVLARDGRLVAALPGLGLDPGALRAAILEAGLPGAGEPRMLERVLLACRGFGAIGTGARGAALSAALALGALVTLAGLGGVAWLLRTQRRRGA